MDTPIADFVKKYIDSDTSRLHMPGHKGKGPLGIESMDITEIKGADALYEASGIIEKSEANATALFGTQKTLYSTEGSSQCIRAMLFLAIQAKQAENGGRPLILAARNVHKAFLYAGALLDFRVEWLYSDSSDSICSCIISPDALEKKLSSMDETPSAVYITSPDYLGGMSDIKALAIICHRYNTYLLVDNAHGAYTKFLSPSMHPMDMGADICCDSAHKTLPVLTGGAYLHIGKNAPKEFAKNAKQALALFGSTSPSYLILQSLDMCNKYLAGCSVAENKVDTYAEKLNNLCRELASFKSELKGRGWKVMDSDPLKLVIRCDGNKVAEALRAARVECEYADEDYVVFMLTPENDKRDFDRISRVLSRDFYNSIDGVEDRMEKTSIPISENTRVMSLRQAFWSSHETVDIEEAAGRICASPLVSCPPAIPIVISGEIISQDTIELFKKYHIQQVEVVAE